MDTAKSKIYKLLKNIYQKGFFHLLSSNMAVRVLGFGSQLFVITLLSPTELGQIRVLQTFGQVALTLSLFGFSTTILKLCSDPELKEFRSALFYKYIAYALFTTIAVVCIITILATAGFLSPDLAIARLQPIFILAVPGSVIFTLLGSYLQAIKKPKIIAFNQILLKVLGVFLLVTCTYLYGIDGFVIGTVLISYIGLPILLYNSKDYLIISKAQWKNRNAYKLSGNLSSWGFFASVTHMLMNQVDILILNYLESDRERFGYYSIARTLLIPYRELAKTVRSVSLPYLTEKKGDMGLFMSTMQKYQRLMLIQSLIAIVAGIIIVQGFSALVAPVKYHEVATFFSVLVLGYIFHSYSALIPTSLISLGAIKITFYAAITYTPLAYIIHWVLINNAGLIGAAWANVLSTSLMMLILILFHRKHLTTYISRGTPS